MNSETTDIMDISHFIIRKKHIVELMKLRQIFIFILVIDVNIFH